MHSPSQFQGTMYKNYGNMLSPTAKKVTDFGFQSKLPISPKLQADKPNIDDKFKPTKFPPEHKSQNTFTTLLHSSKNNYSTPVLKADLNLGRNFNNKNNESAHPRYFDMKRSYTDLKTQ